MSFHGVLSKQMIKDVSGYATLNTDDGTISISDGNTQTVVSKTTNKYYTNLLILAMCAGWGDDGPADLTTYLQKDGNNLTSLSATWNDASAGSGGPAEGMFFQYIDKNVPKGTVYRLRTTNTDADHTLRIRGQIFFLSMKGDVL